MPRKRVQVAGKRANVDRRRADRLRAVALEACEQCRRLDVPEISDPLSLAELLAAQDETKPVLIHLDETGRGKRAADLFAGLENAAFLTGPEGGFSEAERTLIAKTPNTAGLDLGERILRAETASIAALALFMCR